MFLDRSKRDQGANLAWRVRLLGVGALLAMLGIGAQREWLINVALGVLILGFGLRFVGRRSEGTEDDTEEEV